MVSLPFQLCSLQFLKRSRTCPLELGKDGRLQILTDNEGLETLLVRLHQELQRLIRQAVLLADNRQLPLSKIIVRGPALVDWDTWIFSYVGCSSHRLEGVSLRALRTWYYQQYGNGYRLRVFVNNDRTEISFPRPRHYNRSVLVAKQSGLPR